MCRIQTDLRNPVTILLYLKSAATESQSKTAFSDPPDPQDPRSKKCEANDSHEDRKAQQQKGPRSFSRAFSMFVN
jgi:hypothetical protein